MTTTVAVATILVFVGGIFLALSIRLSLSIHAALSQKLRLEWLAFTALIGLLILLLVAFEVTLLMELKISIAVVGGSALFVGAGFVLLALTLARWSLTESVESARAQHARDTSEAARAAYMPAGDPIIRGLKLSSYFQSASVSGGDWYGTIVENGRCHVLIGDVTGYGVPATLVAAAVTGTCQAIQRNLETGVIDSISPSALLDQLNLTVSRVGAGDLFMTFFVACFDLEQGLLRYASAGHTYPFMVRSTPPGVPRPALARVEGIGLPGPRLGTPHATFTEREIRVNPGDLFVLYTDGILKCENATGHEYGMREIRRTLRSHSHLPIAALRDRIVENAFTFFGGHPLRDDITLTITRVESVPRHTTAQLLAQGG